MNQPSAFSRQPSAQDQPSDVGPRPSAHDDDLGRKNFEAFFAAMKQWCPGQVTPYWDQQSQTVKNAWIVAALAVQRSSVVGLQPSATPSL